MLTEKIALSLNIMSYIYLNFHLAFKNVRRTLTVEANRIIISHKRGQLETELVHKITLNESNLCS